MVVSLDQGTLRLDPGDGTRGKVFAAGVGRLNPDGPATPEGSFSLGPDPGDRDMYLPRRHLPSFHRGLPFLRLDLPRRDPGGRPRYPMSLHGPVTPTLIWGQVSRGCIRLSPDAIKEVFRVAVRRPSMPVVILRGADRFAGEVVQPDLVAPPLAGCPEAALGVRRLRRVAAGSLQNDRVCGGVDHWYALEAKGDDQITVVLRHGGGLRVELYGIRAISAVASGERGFVHHVPNLHRNRGDRFIRVVAPADERGRGGFSPYTLTVSLSGR